MRLKKAFCALTLGAVLALGVLAGTPASALTWVCGPPNNGVYTCFDVIIDGAGVAHFNNGFWCRQTGPFAGGICYYT